MTVGGTNSGTTEPTGSAIDPCFLPGRTSAGEVGHHFPLEPRPPLLSTITSLLIGPYFLGSDRAAGKRRDFTVPARRMGKSEAVRILCKGEGSRILGKQGALIIDEFAGLAK